MVKGQKRIDFNELHRLVANVDYIDPTSFPLFFSVNGHRYCCGIEGNGEQQYIAEVFPLIDMWLIIDWQDPDNMEWDRIGEMLKKKCLIDEAHSNKIWLNTVHSFSGKRFDLDKDLAWSRNYFKIHPNEWTKRHGQKVKKIAE